MKVKISIILILSVFYNTLLAQHSNIDIKVMNYKYEINTSSLTFDLVIKNESNDTLALIKPLKYFFNKHWEFKVYDYPQLKSYPYKVEIRANKKCKNEESPRIPKAYQGKEYLTTKHIFKLPPKSSQEFKKIKLNIDDIEFCDNSKYFLEIAYNAEIIKTDLNSTDDIEVLISKLKKVEKEIEVVAKKYYLRNIVILKQINELTKINNKINGMPKIDNVSGSSKKIFLKKK